MTYKHEVFIDGSNFYATVRLLDLRVDYARLRDWLISKGTTRINYLTAIYEDEDGNRELQKLADWLAYNGFTIISKPAKAKTNTAGERHIKGNMDVEIAVFALQAGEYCDEITLFTGDGDFISLVKALQQKGVKVNVASSVKTQPQPIVADELRKQADVFIELADIVYLIEIKNEVESD